MHNARSQRGFSLIETLIAAGLLCGALTGLAHLAVISVRQGTSSRQALAAQVLAQSKLEELRGATWQFLPNGTRVSSPLLAPSPAGALTTDQAGWVEDLDRFGAPVAGGQVPHYKRRWAVAPPTALDLDTLQLQVCVTGADSTAVADACVYGLVVRQP